MTQTMNATQWLAGLVPALREASIAAVHASEKVTDNGTCNLDSLVLRPPRGIRTNSVHQAVEAAGLHCSQTSWLGCRGFFLHLNVGGQADKRVAGNQAARAVLERHGYEVDTYYAMD